MTKYTARDAAGGEVPPRDTPALRELQARDQWICWDSETRPDGASTKVPKDAWSGSTCNACDPKRWTSHAVAAAAAERFGFAGVGYAFAANDPYVGIDLDDCVDPATGEITPEAGALVEQVGSYWEVSPSGTGLKGWVRGCLPHAVKHLDPGDPLKLEMYDRDRYFAVTGRHLPGTAETIEEGQGALDLLVDRYGEPPKARRGRATRAEVAAALDAAGIRHRAKPTAYGTVLRLTDRCLTSDAHDDGAWFTCFPDGTAKYGCQHASCRGKGWSDAAPAIGLSGQEVTPGGPHGGRRASQATELHRLAEDAGVELFHDPKGVGYAAVPVGDHTETLKVTGPRMAGWLTTSYLDRRGSVPGKAALDEAVHALDALARLRGEERRVWLRVGQDAAGAVWLDLGREDWPGVKVTPEGWEVLPLPPGMFRRSAGMQPLPVPTRGGRVDDLRPWLNIPDDDAWALYVGGLLVALHPDAQYPIASFTGEQGSGKTTSAEAFRFVVDPNATPLLSPPETERNLWVAAEHHRVLVFDNLSFVRRDLSDALCKLATGGGYAHRKNYTDDEQVAFGGTRPVVLTSIAGVASNGDLLDRTALIRHPAIEAAGRRTKAEVWDGIARARPGVLGALLDAASAALGNAGAPDSGDLPRMADAATWVAGAAPALGWAPDRYVAAWRANRDEAHEETVQGSLFGAMLVEHLKRVPAWTGEARELLRELNGALGYQRPDDGWPKTPRAVVAALDRLTPALKGFGVEVERGPHLREPGTGRRRLKLTNTRYDAIKAAEAAQGDGPIKLLRFAGGREELAWVPAPDDDEDTACRTGGDGVTVA